MEEKQHPLIIVFYLDAELMKQRSIIEPFAESVNEMFRIKQTNALAFFIPTTSEERVECINPVMLAPADMEKVYAIIEDVKNSFMVDVDVPDEEVELDGPFDAPQESINKPCDCGNNPGGECKCD